MTEQEARSFVSARILKSVDVYTKKVDELAADVEVLRRAVDQIRERTEEIGFSVDTIRRRVLVLEDSSTPDMSPNGLVS